MKPIVAQKRMGSKIGEWGQVYGKVMYGRWPHQLNLNLFLIAAQYNFFVVIVILCFSTPKFSYVIQSGVVASIGVVREFS